MNPGIAATKASAGFSVETVRRQFPCLAQTVNAKPLIYLDNGATTQKPQSVIDAITHYYSFDNANVHRGVHTLSQRATDAFDAAREKVARFIAAPSSKDVVFVRGTTEAVNLVAQTFVRPRLSPGDEIIVSQMEHHSNIVPWQIVCEQTGATLHAIPVLDNGELDLEAYSDLLNPRTRFVSLIHVSNSLGTINPVEEMIRRAHANNTPIMLDGAQATAHMKIDVTSLDCDFYAFSGHKLYGPTGIGCLYGKTEHLTSMPPYHGGGDMIREVSFDGSSYAPPPARFEAGTPNVAGVIGLGAAIDFMNGLDMDGVRAHEDRLLKAATDALSNDPSVRLIGTAECKTAILSFVIKGAHPHDIGTIMDNQGVAIRAGHHCTMPLMRRYHVPATARASFAVYNNMADVQAFIGAVDKVKEIFRL